MSIIWTGHSQFAKSLKTLSNYDAALTTDVYVKLIDSSMIQGAREIRKQVS